MTDEKDEKDEKNIKINASVNLKQKKYDFSYAIKSLSYHQSNRKYLYDALNYIKYLYVSYVHNTKAYIEKYPFDFDDEFNLYIQGFHPELENKNVSIIIGECCDNEKTLHMKQVTSNLSMIKVDAKTIAVDPDRKYIKNILLKKDILKLEMKKIIVQFHNTPYERPHPRLDIPPKYFIIEKKRGDNK